MNTQVCRLIVGIVGLPFISTFTNTGEENTSISSSIVLSVPRKADAGANILSTATA